MARWKVQEIIGAPSIAPITHLLILSTLMAGELTDRGCTTISVCYYVRYLIIRNLRADAYRSWHFRPLYLKGCCIQNHRFYYIRSLFGMDGRVHAMTVPNDMLPSSIHLLHTCLPSFFSPSSMCICVLNYVGKYGCMLHESITGNTAHMHRI